jgi:PBSX family phage terminase large subunit
MKLQATTVFQTNWDALQSQKYKYIVNSGSSRSSKTFSIIQIFWILAWTKPRTKLSIFRNTKKDCKDTILQDMLKYYPTLPNWSEVVYNKTESTLTFPNGSTIFIEGTEDSLKVHGYHSDYLWFNEVYKVPLEVFNQLDMRCTTAVFLDYNPIGRMWSDDLILRDNAIVIHSTFKDNPFIPFEQKKKILSYEPTEYNIEQKTADNYLWTVYGLGLKAEKPNRIFKGWQIMTERAFYDLPYQSYYATDFGLSAPTANIEFKFDGDKTFFFHQRLYKPMNLMQGSLSEEFNNLGTIKSKENICDSGNELNKAEGTKLRNNGYNVIFAQKGHGSINAGIETLQKCNIFYTASSLDLEQEYENYSWKIYQGIQMDVPEDNCNDHALDCCRMGVSWYVKTRRLSI